MARKHIDPVNRKRRLARSHETLPKGFSRFGLPTTCGAPTSWGGECAAEAGPFGWCDNHDPQTSRQRRPGNAASTPRSPIDCPDE